MNPDEILKLKITDLDYMLCMSCKNYFFVHPICDSSIDDPTYCPYCGVRFENEMEV